MTKTYQRDPGQLQRLFQSNNTVPDAPNIAPVHPQQTTNNANSSESGISPPEEVPITQNRSNNQEFAFEAVGDGRP